MKFNKQRKLIQQEEETDTEFQKRRPGQALIEARRNPTGTQRLKWNARLKHETQKSMEKCSTVRERGEAVMVLGEFVA